LWAKLERKKVKPQNLYKQKQKEREVFNLKKKECQV